MYFPLKFFEYAIKFDKVYINNFPMYLDIKEYFMDFNSSSFESTKAIRLT